MNIASQRNQLFKLGNSSKCIALEIGQMKNGKSCYGLYNNIVLKQTKRLIIL
jgi:hypothetical protein